jgi:hypothetical protein
MLFILSCENDSFTVRWGLKSLCLHLYSFVADNIQLHTLSQFSLQGMHKYLLQNRILFAKHSGNTVKHLKIYSEI